MARVHVVQKSREEHKCGRCGEVIPKGTRYFWAKPGFRTRRPVIRCLKHPFRQSELTTGVRSEALAAVEAFDDAMTNAYTFEDLESARADLESSLEDYVSTRQEALDAWENGNSQLEEYVEQAETAYDEVANFEIDTSRDEETPEEDELTDWVDTNIPEEEEMSEEHLVGKWREAQFEEAKSELEDLVAGLDL